MLGGRKLTCRIASIDWITKSLSQNKLLDDTNFLHDDDDIIYEYQKKKARLDKLKRKTNSYADEDEGVK